MADLLAEGVPPDGILAFTFTEKAAAELRQRIAERAEERLGRDVVDQLGRLSVGTIHAYCFRLLQTAVPRFETFDVLDEHRVTTFLDCAMAYRLRSLVGFQPRLTPELGYGKVIHHVLRTIADATRASGTVPDPAAVEALLATSFFLPSASKPAHRQLRGAARRLVQFYIDDHADDLHRVRETERPFELHLDGLTVTGRADVISDHEGDTPTALAILDYKTSTRAGTDHDLQLQTYADAGRREGLDVRRAYVHDLAAGTRTPVDVGEEVVNGAEVGSSRPPSGSTTATTRPPPARSAGAARCGPCTRRLAPDQAGRAARQDVHAVAALWGAWPRATEVFRSTEGPGDGLRWDAGAVFGRSFVDGGEPLRTTTLVGVSSSRRGHRLARVFRCERGSPMSRPRPMAVGRPGVRTRSCPGDSVRQHERWVRW